MGYPYTVENTAYDADGKVLFYIQNMNVYDANGTGVDRLPSGVYTYLLETEAGPLSGKFVKQ